MVVKCKGKEKVNGEVFFRFFVTKSCNNAQFTRKVCTKNRRAVACWYQHWRAGIKSGVLVSTVACWYEQWRADIKSGVLISTVAC